MLMKPLFRDKRQIAHRKKIIKIIILLIFFLFLLLVGFFTFSKRVFNFIGKPIWQAKKAVFEEVDDSGFLFKSRSSLFKENKKISEENSRLKIEMIDYQILKNENEKLKEILDRISDKKEFILASILVKPNYSPYDTLIIDVGEKDGISEKMKVYVNGNVPIGLIKEVYLNTSLVELYSNPGNVSLGIINILNTSVELFGRGGGNFEMSVPFELSLRQGEMVFLPGIKAEVLAIIQEEISESADPIKKVILHSPVNIQNQKWVQVRKN
jgi:cell shape-determining protein MreC